MIWPSQSPRTVGSRWPERALTGAQRRHPTGHNTAPIGDWQAFYISARGRCQPLVRQGRYESDGPSDAHRVEPVRSYLSSGPEESPKPRRGRTDEPTSYNCVRKTPTARHLVLVLGFPTVARSLPHWSGLTLPTPLRPGDLGWQGHPMRRRPGALVETPGPFCFTALCREIALGRSGLPGISPGPVRKYPARPRSP